MSTPEQELKRLLHYGLSIPYYEPGDRLLEESYQNTTSTKLKKLLESEKLSSEAANIIVKAFSDGYSPHPVMLVYSLVVCIKHSNNQQLKEAAYKAVKTVCASPENLFLFIKFATKLCQNNSIWGSGCRKILKEWYLKKDVKSLAEIVGKQKKCHGWSHKDIIKLIHLKTANEPARAAIVKYLMFGIKAAKKEFSENAEANEVLNHLQAVEDLKHLTDEQQAARNIEIHRFTLDHVPPHLMKSKEVWGALVGNIPLTTLLKNLEKIGYLGFLKPNTLLANKVVDALNDENAIAESHLHPAQVYITLRNYETSSKFMAAENARKLRRATNGSGEPKKVVKVPPKPNPKVIAALNDLFASTCKLFLAPTGLRYFVAVDLRSFSASDTCYRSPHVTLAQGCAVTVLSLLHADRNVSVRVAKANEEIVPVALTTSMTVQQTIKCLEETSMQRMKLSTPLEWALKSREEFDVFVVVTDINHKTHQNCVAALQKYREETKLPNVKLVLVLLKCHVLPSWIGETNDSGVFVIGGFDGHVPRLIEAFSRGAF